MLLEILLDIFITFPLVDDGVHPLLSTVPMVTPSNLDISSMSLQSNSADILLSILLQAKASYKASWCLNLYPKKSFTVFNFEFSIPL
ncbi:hypothetical protein D3C76_1455940 [compost metagenome]